VRFEGKMAMDLEMVTLLFYQGEAVLIFSNSPCVDA
jgi:hypothetical protein